MTLSRFHIFYKPLFVFYKSSALRRMRLLCYTVLVKSKKEKSMILDTIMKLPNGKIIERCGKTMQ